MLNSPSRTSYSDRKTFWDGLLYLFAIIGAGFLFAGEIIVGSLFAVVSYLFSTRSFRYETGENKKSELTAAIYNEDTDYIHSLLEKGKSPNQIDGAGTTPLMACAKTCRKKTLEILKLLQQHGAKVAVEEELEVLDVVLSHFRNSLEKGAQKKHDQGNQLEIVRHVLAMIDRDWTKNMELNAILDKFGMTQDELLNSDSS